MPLFVDVIFLVTIMYFNRVFYFLRPNLAQIYGHSRPVTRSNTICYQHYPALRFILFSDSSCTRDCLHSSDWLSELSCFQNHPALKIILLSTLKYNTIVHDKWLLNICHSNPSCRRLRSWKILFINFLFLTSLKTLISISSIRHYFCESICLITSYLCQR